jgi:hypothetical protein
MMRQKLVNFLQTSLLYTPEKMLSLFPEDSLFEERAILLSKIGQHDQALTIYAYKLDDKSLAQRYCEQNYADDEKNKDVYLSLLRVYLNPPPGRYIQKKIRGFLSFFILTHFCFRL